MSPHVLRRGKRVLRQGATRASAGRPRIALIRSQQYENQSPTPQIIGLTPPFPGKVIPLDLDRYSGLTIKRHSFLAAYDENVQFSVRMAKSASAGCCGGQGFVLNSLVGRGQAFLVAAGTVLERFLKPGEELLVQGHSVVAFEKTVDYDVRRVGGCLMCCCGGQGATNTVLRGPGMVLIQSMSASLRSAPRQPWWCLNRAPPALGVSSAWRVPFGAPACAAAAAAAARAPEAAPLDRRADAAPQRIS